MGAEKRLLPVTEAFQLAQQPHRKQAKLVGALSRTCRSIAEKIKELARDHGVFQ